MEKSPTFVFVVPSRRLKFQMKQYESLSGRAMSLVNAYQEPTKPLSAYFRRWKDWKGTSSRAELWAGLFWSTLIFSAATFYLFADPYGVFSNVIFIAAFVILGWLGLAVNVRRARDLGWRPATLLLTLIPFIGLIWSVRLVAQAGRNNDST